MRGETEPELEREIARRGGDGAARPLRAASTAHLIRDLTSQIREIAHTQVDLFKAEVRNDLHAELRMVVGFGVGGVCAIVVLCLLMVALALAIAIWLPGWLSALIVAAFVAAIGATVSLVGWTKRAREPLARTRRSLKEGAQWLRERRA